MPRRPSKVVKRRGMSIPKQPVKPRVGKSLYEKLTGKPNPKWADRLYNNK